MSHWTNSAALPPATWSSRTEVARRPRESRAVMLDDIPDAQVAAQAAPDPGGSQRELGVDTPGPGYPFLQVRPGAYRLGRRRPARAIRPL
ncbi:hypothetical protein ACWCQW_33325 [Streptomyces mirabilis]